MSIDYEQDRQRYRVRRREDGRQRSRRFNTQEEAERFAASVSEPPADSLPNQDAKRPAGDGVYSSRGDLEAAPALSKVEKVLDRARGQERPGDPPWRRLAPTGAVT